MSKPESGKTFEVKCVVVGNTGTGKTWHTPETSI